MTEVQAWRSVWGQFRIRLIDNAAIHFIDRRSELTEGDRPSWDQLNALQRWEVTETIAEIFLAMDHAMQDDSLLGDERGTD